MAIPLLLANFSPVGPAVQIAVLGVITVFFIWFVGREWFGKITGLVASGLYAISPTAIVFSKSSWNPNIMPFFALLSIYSVWRIWNKKQFNWLIVLGISYAFVLQSHYLGLFLAPTLFLFWLLTYKDLRLSKNSKEDLKLFIRKSLLGILVILGLMSPLLIFDIRHNWTNFLAIKTMLTSGADIGFSLASSLSGVSSVSFMLISSLLSVKNIYLGAATFAFIFIFLIWMIKTKKIKGAFALVFFWLIMGLVGFSFYKKPVFDHYFEFLFPVPFLIIGVMAQYAKKSKAWFFAFGIYFLVLVGFSVFKSPVFSNPTYQMQRAISVAKVIQEKANGERFNIATISDLNNRDVYQYFLILWGEKVVDTDPSSLEFTVTDQLFVVCELPEEKCDPVHNPSAWITSFGWTKIEDQWDVWGGTLYKLGHAK